MFHRSVPSTPCERAGLSARRGFCLASRSRADRLAPPSAVGLAHLVGIDVLNEALEGWHPAWGQVAVLEEDPLAPLYGTAHHGFCPRALWGWEC